MKNKGFTLIELLAVIIILGILMIIAIPSVTNYINNSRKSAYVDTAKEIISGTRILVNDGKLGMYDTSATYYIPAKYIKTEGGEAKSPYGNLDEAYVGVVFNGTGYKYYWVSRDETGQGFNKIISGDNIEEDLIKSDIEAEYVNDLVQKSAIGCNKNIKILNENGSWDDYLASEYVIDKDLYKGNNSCPNCVFARIENTYIQEGREINISTVNDYKELDDYSSKPFLGINLNGNIIDTLHICLVAGENLLCLDSIFEAENFECHSYITANGIGVEKFTSSREEYNQASEACQKLYYTDQYSSVPGVGCKSDKYGYSIAYGKGDFIGFMASNNYVCNLQITKSNPTNKEWGICTQR